MRKLPERTNEMAGVYAGQCIELAREMHISCVNIWSKLQETEGADALPKVILMVRNFAFVVHSTIAAVTLYSK